MRKEKILKDEDGMEYGFEAWYNYHFKQSGRDWASVHGWSVADFKEVWKAQNGGTSTLILYDKEGPLSDKLKFDDVTPFLHIKIVDEEGTEELIENSEDFLDKVCHQDQYEYAQIQYCRDERDEDFD